MTPSLSIFIPSAAGILGKPGILIISPRIGIMNPAPAANSNSRTVTLKPVGLPIFFSSSDKDFEFLPYKSAIYLSLNHKWILTDF